jgi:hypothetical protein
MGKEIRMNKQSTEAIVRLTASGIGYDDALALRRIAMTLHRWFELECGDGNSYASWAIERNGGGKPFFVRHCYGHGKVPDWISRRSIPDREAGARKRLAKIMARYPEHWAYVQTDPRGAALYVGQTTDADKGRDLDQYYNRGVALFR